MNWIINKSLCFLHDTNTVDVVAALTIWIFIGLALWIYCLS